MRFVHPVHMCCSVVLKPQPCLVLLESPPGVGKTHFVENALAAEVRDIGPAHSTALVRDIGPAHSTALVRDIGTAHSTALVRDIGTAHSTELVRDLLEVEVVG
jgi:hypothetical protein